MLPSSAIWKTCHHELFNNSLLDQIETREQLMLEITYLKLSNEGWFDQRNSRIVDAGY